MANYALVKDGAVSSVVVWDGVPFTPATDDAPAFGWSPPDGYTAIEIPNDSYVTEGWTYDGTTFTAPPVQVPVLSSAEILASNTATRDSLSAIATNQIAILTDATDPDIVDTVDPADVASLRAWKQYRVALSKLDLTRAIPAWPTPPSS